MYFPRNWEFGSALSKLWNFGGFEPPNPLSTPLNGTVLRLEAQFPTLAEIFLFLRIIHIDWAAYLDFLSTTYCKIAAVVRGCASGCGTDLLRL
jgi:hypothetical protein